MQLIPAANAHLPFIRRLYAAAFPGGERKPFWLILRTVRRGKGQLLVIRQGGFLVGFFAVLQHQDLVLVDYFAIRGAARGRGLGSRALALLRGRFPGKRLFLEIEMPNQAEPDNTTRLRRKEFYRRAGFAETGVCVQIYGTPMQLLSYGCAVRFEEYTGLLRAVFGAGMARLLFIRRIPC